MTHACPDLSGLVQTIFGMHLECFFSISQFFFFFSIDGTSQGCCQSSDADWCFYSELCPCILEHSCLQPSGGDIPVPVRSPKSSTVERGLYLDG